MILIPAKVDIQGAETVILGTIATAGRLFVGPDRTTEYVVCNQEIHPPKKDNVSVFNLSTFSIEQALANASVYPV